MGNAQLFAGIHSPVLAAQPLSVHEMRAREIDAHSGAPEPIDRLAVVVLGSRHRRRPAHGSAPVCPAPNPFRRPPAFPSAATASTAASRSPQRTPASMSSASDIRYGPRSSCSHACLRCAQRLLVATETVVEYRGHATDQADDSALAAGTPQVRWWPRSAASPRPPRRATRLSEIAWYRTGAYPVATAIVSASSINAAAASNSPANTWIPARVASASGSMASAPASRASRTARGSHVVPQIVVPQFTCSAFLRDGKALPERTHHIAVGVRSRLENLRHRACATSADSPRGRR